MLSGKWVGAAAGIGSLINWSTKETDKHDNSLDGLYSWVQLLKKKRWGRIFDNIWPRLLKPTKPTLV